MMTKEEFIIIAKKLLSVLCCSFFEDGPTIQFAHIQLILQYRFYPKFFTCSIFLTLLMNPIARLKFLSYGYLLLTLLGKNHDSHPNVSIRLYIAKTDLLDCFINIQGSWQTMETIVRHFVRAESKLWREKEDYLCGNECVRVRARAQYNILLFIYFQVVFYELRTAVSAGTTDSSYLCLLKQLGIYRLLSISVR